MTQTNLFSFGLRALAMTALCVGLASAARGNDTNSEAVPAQASRVTGIALQDGGVLYGQLLDAQGRPAAGQEVRILSQGRLIVATETNAHGRFGVRSLRGGLHTVESTVGSQSVQLWAPGTAPPSANQVVVIAAGQDTIVRAQNGGDNYGPAVRGAVAGGLITGLTYWALDYNPTGS